MFESFLTNMQLEEEIAMRAALGLPVPQIRREKKTLEENDLTVLAFLLFYYIDIIRKR